MAFRVLFFIVKPNCVEDDSYYVHLMDLPPRRGGRTMYFLKKRNILAWFLRNLRSDT
jgi:hypothetical protein